MPASKPPASATVTDGPNAPSIGTSAACIMVTILAANLAATRAEASLPYLVQAAPLALRFNEPAPPLPPVPERYTADEPKLSPGTAALSTDGSTVSNDSTDSSETSPETSTGSVAHSAPTPPSSAQTGTVADEGVALVPDIYAPRPIVRIDDLLPFFVPPAAPPSRASYKLK